MRGIARYFEEQRGHFSSVDQLDKRLNWTVGKLEVGIMFISVQSNLLMEYCFEPWPSKTDSDALHCNALLGQHCIVLEISRRVKSSAMENRLEEEEEEE